MMYAGYGGCPTSHSTNTNSPMRYGCSQPARPKVSISTSVRARFDHSEPNPLTDIVLGPSLFGLHRRAQPVHGVHQGTSHEPTRKRSLPGQVQAAIHRNHTQNDQSQRNRIEATMQGKTWNDGAGDETEQAEDHCDAGQWQPGARLQMTDHEADSSQDGRRRARELAPQAR